MNLPEDIYSLPLKIKIKSGELVELNAVYQDTKPKGSSLGTFLTIHGAPGSHKDFKYITPRLMEAGIRVIGINFPGLGWTPGDLRLYYDNHERNQCIQQIINNLDLKNIVFCGHSRGTENAIMMAATNQERTSGVVLLNPTGLSRHKGIRPEWAVNALATAARTWGLRALNEAFLYQFYTRVLKFKVKTSSECAVCVQYMSQCALGDQREFIEDLNKNDKIKVVICAAGKDHLVEKHILKDLISTFKDSPLIEVNSSGDEEETSELMRKNSEEGKIRQGFLFLSEVLAYTAPVPQGGNPPPPPPPQGGNPPPPPQGEPTGAPVIPIIA
ncbi:hypothetical protein FO519_004516 [Halicephalobus sp. NKZ332]|nr:hypothetical protein FO519_004516 [Halicephalobus sp. NKZ332]